MTSSELSARSRSACAAGGGGAFGKSVVPREVMLVFESAANCACKGSRSASIPDKRECVSTVYL